MKLNEHSKNELRKEIEEAVKRVPEGQRIELPLDLLDDLIFLKIKDKVGVTVKIPIWTGEFLRKIDLSKLSFENVILQSKLSPGYNDGEYIDNNLLSTLKSGEYSFPFINFFDSSKKREYFIDFSYTNVNIDFKKIYDTIIEGINLEGVNLESLNIKDLNLTSCTNCNFSNTHITQIPFLYCSSCNFANNDLSNFEIDLDEFINDNVDDENSFSNFIGTGVKFKFNFDLSQDCIKEEVFNYLKNGLLGGCYLNSKFIDLKEVKEQKKQSLQEEYEELKKDIFSSTLGSIEEQIRGFKGK